MPEIEYVFTAIKCLFLKRDQRSCPIRAIK